MSDIYDDEVGYKKPPKESQFKKGKSGNPSGRPRREPSLVHVLRKVSRQVVHTKGPDGPRRMSKLEASVTQLVNKAVTGDMKAMKVWLQWLSRFPELITNPEIINIIVRPASPPSTTADKKVDV
jgi:hypothetical protein